MNNMLLRAAVFLLPALILAGCIGTKPARFAVEPIAAAGNVRSNARTIAVTKVNLPAYAKETGIFVENETGALVPVPKADWADDTDRAMLLSLVRNIGELTGATVAADPWPLGGVPEAEVRVEVERMLVDRTLTMRLSGQFSVRRDRATSRNLIGQFEIDTPAASRAPEDVVRAHADAWRELARVIAKAL